MLDLKAKLAAAGLVTEADIAAAERKPGPRKPPRPAPERPAGPPPPRPGLDVAALRRASKGEAYDQIRRAVERARLDAASPSAAAEPFHFTTARGQLSRLVLEPPTRDAVTRGDAGITAFMSHHGLAHAVVPRALAEAIAELFPLWLRTLQGHPGAGQLEPRPARDPGPGRSDPEVRDTSPAPEDRDASPAPEDRDASPDARPKVPGPRDPRT